MLSTKDITDLLAPYTSIDEAMAQQLSAYLDLLLKWNARTNLTAIREPEEIVRRHFGESLFAAKHIGECNTLLDLGSGAGLPGIPIQLAHPQLAVTLAESQNKKASFLREAVRTLNLPTQVWAARAETMPADRVFDVVTMRAVDNMAAAMEAAAPRASKRIVLFATDATTPALPQRFNVTQQIAMPGTAAQHLLLVDRE